MRGEGGLKRGKGGGWGGRLMLVFDLSRLLKLFQFSGTKIVNYLSRQSLTTLITTQHSVSHVHLSFFFNCKYPMTRSDRRLLVGWSVGLLVGLFWAEGYTSRLLSEHFFECL